MNSSDPKFLIKRTTLYINTYNVGTLSTDSHLSHLENEIKNIKLDIIGISERRRPPMRRELIELKVKHLLYSYGREKVKQNGVSFLINKDLKANVIAFTAISDRKASFTV